MITIFHQLDARLDDAFGLRKTKEQSRSFLARLRRRSTSTTGDGVVVVDEVDGEGFDEVDIEEVGDDVVVVDEVDGEGLDEVDIEEVGDDVVVVDEVAASDESVGSEDPVVIDDAPDDVEMEAGEPSSVESDPDQTELVEEGVNSTEFQPLPVDVLSSDESGADQQFERSVNELVSAKFTSFVERAVERASLAAGSRIERDDLSQVAQLAALEAGSFLNDVAPEQRSKFLRASVTGALKEELKSVADNGSLTSLPLINEDEMDDLVSVDRLLEHDDETAVKLVASAEVATEVRSIIGTMPEEIATVVRLRFGLDGAPELTPTAIAKHLEIDAERVADHLWAAETLIRHSSAAGDHRRRAVIGSREFQAFRWEGDLASYDLRHVNLNNVNLEHCDLSGAVVSGMNLWGAKLFRAKLIGTNLWGAQVDNSDLQQTDLSQANFERASLCGANLRLADASHANFWGADFGGAQLEHANFHQADLRSANLAGLNLSRTNFTGANLSGADLRGCMMDEAQLAGANLRGADLTNVSLQFADLRNTDMCWANMAGADLYGASMQGAVQSPALRYMFASKAPRPRRLRSVAG